MLSVIIPTRNRADSLASVLNSLLKQILPVDNFEVLVVDNDSNDHTRQVVRKFQKHFYNLHYFYEKIPGLHVGRHCGMREAAGDILVFTDDDVEATPAWLSSIYESFNDDDVILVGGKCLPHWEVPPPSWLLERWDGRKIKKHLGALSLLDFGDEKCWIDPSWIWGCNFSIRKSALMSARGFHPDGMPDDLLHLRGDGESYVSRLLASQGVQALYHPQATVYHKVTKARMAPKYFEKRAFMQGISDSFSALRASSGDFCTVRTKALTTSKICQLTERFRLLYRLLPLGVQIKCRENRSYRQGWDWHQQRFSADPELRDWVLRDDYWGA